MPWAPLSRKREHSCWHTPRGQSSGTLPNEESRKRYTEHACQRACEALGPCCAGAEHARWCGCCGTPVRGLCRESEPPPRLAVPPLGALPKEPKAGAQGLIHRPSGIFTTAERGSDAPRACVRESVRERYAHGGKSFSLNNGRNTGACSVPCKP